jgi:GNAT superfamily N-acetyltransferase
MEPILQIIDKPTSDDREAVLSRLTAFNAQNGYPADTRPVAILLKDEAGDTVGGLWGRTNFDWLFVEFLVVPEQLRGRDFGTKLMDEAERMAVERGCVGAWLTTFSFQARSFYEKRGYAAFGELPNSPRDNVRIFMSKRLDRRQETSEMP